MKTPVLFFIILFCTPAFFAQAQLYSPEIKVQQTTGNQVEIGSDQTNSNLKVYGGISTNDGIVTVINPGSSPSGSSIALTSPSTNPGITINEGDGSGGVLRRWDIYSSSGTFYIENKTNNSQLFSIEPGGGMEAKKITVGNQGDNSQFFFNAANGKTAAVGLQDDGTDGFYISIGGAYRMHVNENGRIGVGVVNAGYKLHVNGTVAASNFITLQTVN